MISFHRNVPTRLMLLIVTVGLIAIAAALTDRLPHPDGAVELMFPSSSPALQALTTERSVFENPTMDVITLSRGKLDLQEFRDRIYDLEDLLLELNGVESTISPTNEQVAKVFGLASDKYQNSRILVKINSELPHSKRVALNAELNSLLAQFRDLKPARAGSLFTSIEVAEGISGEIERLAPFVVTSMILVASAVLRSLWLATALTLISSCSLVCLLLFYSLLDFGLGPISQIGPPFLLAVGGAFHLHVAARLIRVEHSERPHVRKELTRAIAWAALTTSIGIISLMTLDMVDIKRFAVLAAIGTWLQALSACYILSDDIIPYRPSSYVFKRSRNQELVIALSLILLCCVSLPYVSKINIDTDPKDFLLEHGSAIKSIELSEQRFPGNHFLTLILHHATEKPETYLEEVKRATSLLKKDKNITNIISPLSFQRDFVKVPIFGPLRPSTPSTFFSGKLHASRILIETGAEGRELLSLADEIKHTLTAANFVVEITSLEYIMAQQSTTIVRGVITSLGTVILCTFATLLFVCRDIPLAIIGLIPNLVPLVIVFSVMGISLEKLDIGTTLVATVSLGITIDNTLHLILSYLEGIRKHLTKDEAICDTLRTVVPIFWGSSLILTVVFAWLATARCLPVSNFSYFLTIALVTGLLSDTYLLPALLGIGPQKTLRQNSHG
jgi:predicted RND superfamily exporter protein